LKGQSLFIVASCAIVMINILLKLMLQKFVPFELHRSVTSEAQSTANKISLALFANTLLVTLLVNAYIPSGNPLWGNRQGAKDFDYKVIDNSIFIYILFVTIYNRRHIYNTYETL
jgi:hypothetical protein